MARDLSQAIGREVTLARTNLGLTIPAAARLAHVAPNTQRRVEDGHAGVRLDTVCDVASAMGLKVWGKAFPVRTVSLRDSGQLAIADHLRSLANPALRAALELGLGNGRSIDFVTFGSAEIIAVEIETLLADFQAQYRAASAKRDELAERHQGLAHIVAIAP